MARDVFRPGLSSDFLKELLGNCRLFINPTEQELSKGLFSQQRRCTRQLIDAEKMIEIWRRYCQGELEIASPVAGVECPSCYRFGLETSVFQAVRISDRLRVRSDRARAHHSQARLRLPIADGQLDPGEPGVIQGPRTWRDDVIKTFWTHLTDEEIEQVKALAMKKLLGVYDDAPGKSDAGMSRLNPC